MSRWTSRFESHEFRVQWKRVLEADGSISPEDPAVLSHIDELSRLRKVVGYINQGLLGVDPELLPINFWDAIKDQFSACADQLSAFSSNKAVAHLQQANSHLDNVLVQIRPHVLAKGKLGPALQTAAKAYSGALVAAAEKLQERSNLTQTALEKAQAQSSSLLDKMKREAQELTQKHQFLLVGSEGQEAVFDGLTRNIEEINSFHRRLATGTDDSPSIKEEIAAAKEAATSGKDAIDKLRLGASSTFKELSAFETRILGAAAEEGKRSGGLSEELDSRLKALGEVEEQQKKRYVALNEQIEALLPGATSAGLASAYKQMKDSFSTPIKRANKVFYASISAIVLLSILVNIEEVGFWWIKFAHLTDWASVGRSLAHKLPFYAPLVWLAYYASKRRSEFQRLEQEYAHKEALAKSYDSYKNQIEELGAEGDSLMRDLLAKAVEAIAFNASSSLDGKHGDKIPLQETLEKALLVATRKVASETNSKLA